MNSILIEYPLNDEFWNDDDVSFFRDRFLFWAYDFYGLKGYKYYVGAKRLDDGVSANVECNTEGNFAVVTISTLKPPRPVDTTRAALDRVAFHEATHVLLAPIMANATIGVGDTRADPAVECIIRLMENVFYSECKERFCETVIEEAATCDNEQAARDARALCEEMKANQQRLNGCDGHDFMDIPDTKCRCTKCGGELDKAQAVWYTRGLEHGRQCQPTLTNI